MQSLQRDPEARRSVGRSERRAVVVANLALFLLGHARAVAGVIMVSAALGIASGPSVFGGRSCGPAVLAAAGGWWTPVTSPAGGGSAAPAVRGAASSPQPASREG